MLCCAVLYCTVLCYAMLCCAVLCCAVISLLCACGVSSTYLIFLLITQYNPSSSSSMKKGLQEGIEDSPHKNRISGTKSDSALGQGSVSGSGTVKGSEGVVLTRALLRTR